MHKPDYYEILGLTASASAAEIKRAWRDLAQVWHPDRFSANPRLRDKAEQKLRAINEAYDQLRTLNPEFRMDENVTVRTFRNATTEPRSNALKGNRWTLPSSFLGRVLLVATATVLMLVAARQMGIALAGTSAGLSSAINHGWSADGPPPIPDLSEVARRLATEAGTFSSIALSETRKLAVTARENPITWRVPAGVGTLRVSNRTSVDAVVKISTEEARRIVLGTVFAPAGKSVVLDNIGPGSYLLSIDTGTEWDRARLRFHWPISSRRDIGPFRFSQIQDSSGLKSDRREVVIVPEDPKP